MRIAHQNSGNHHDMARHNIVHSKHLSQVTVDQVNIHDNDDRGSHSLFCSTNEEATHKRRIDDSRVMGMSILS